MSAIRQNIYPPSIPKRLVDGVPVYAPAVVVIPGKIVMLSGMLARNSAGEIVGKGDMAAQIRQVGENMKDRAGGRRRIAV
jgi:2-iminobutanoate/2-iminopropanoate deaminase